MVPNMFGWSIVNLSVVGTHQPDRCGGDEQARCDLACGSVEKGSCNSLLHQHKDEPLTFVAWEDNNCVKTLSSFHTPEVIKGGLEQRWQDPATRQRALCQLPVDCQSQVESCCETFHLIDGSHFAEAKNDIAGESHDHRWRPELASCFLGMHPSNACNI